MPRHLDVLVPVHLQHVSALLVHHQPANHVRVVVLQLQNFGGVPVHVHEFPARLRVRQNLERLRAVHGEGVIHVESDGGDGVHVEGSVAEDARRGADGEARGRRGRVRSFGPTRNVVGEGIGQGTHVGHVCGPRAMMAVAPPARRGRGGGRGRGRGVAASGVVVRDGHERGDGGEPSPTIGYRRRGGATCEAAEGSVAAARGGGGGGVRREGAERSREGRHRHRRASGAPGPGAARPRVTCGKVRAREAAETGDARACEGVEKAIRRKGRSAPRDATREWNMSRSCTFGSAEGPRAFAGVSERARRRGRRVDGTRAPSR